MKDVLMLVALYLGYCSIVNLWHYYFIEFMIRYLSNIEEPDEYGTTKDEIDEHLKRAIEYKSKMVSSFRKRDLNFLLLSLPINFTITVVSLPFVGIAYCLETILTFIRNSRK